jgi:hypothetical protein
MIPDPLAMIPMPARSGNTSPGGPRATPPLAGPLAWAWRDAQGEATLAYAAWCSDPGADAYAVYRAAQDRADAAQEMLAAAAPGRRGCVSSRANPYR